MKTLKLSLYIAFLILTQLALADDFQAEVSPPEPIANESFFVTFKIKATGDSEPYISFTPSGAQVLGKREQGVSIQTTVINGKFTSSKEQNVVYELISERSGLVVLRNIKVEINGKTTPIKDVHINVLATPKKTPEAFMEAQVSKTRVYVGEGIDVNYYLYFKSSISANDVKDFPKLNKFIKRFHHINSPVETVQYKNEVLKRILAYSARLYPEKVGPAVIDPMKISVQIIENDYNGFGFGSQRYKNKDLASNRVEIEVLPLPTENIPTGFTGLVGVHEFNLIPGKDKYLVNEPIELKLEVKGVGALEKMEAPGIYSDPNLENFDTKAEVTEVGASSAKKVFEYTFLARNNLTVKAREISLAYFDTTSGKYVEKKLQVPGIEVAGVAAPSIGSNDNNIKSNKDDSSKSIKSDPFNEFFSSWFSGESAQSKSTSKNSLGIVGPVFKKDSFFNNYFFSIINIVMLCLVLLLSFKLYKIQNESISDTLSNNIEAQKLLKQIKKSGITHSGLYKLIAMMDKKNKMSNGGVSVNDLLNESDLSRESKLYFKNILESSEQKGYGLDKKPNEIKYESKFFAELMKKV